MTCLHNYIVIESTSTVLKILCTPPIHPLLSPSPLATTNLHVTVSIVLPFPECHVVEIVQYADFSDWLLSLQYYAFKVSACLFMA